MSVRACACVCPLNAACLVKKSPCPITCMRYERGMTNSSGFVRSASSSSPGTGQDLLECSSLLPQYIVVRHNVNVRIQCVVDSLFILSCESRGYIVLMDSGRITGVGFSRVLKQTGNYVE